MTTLSDIHPDIIQIHILPRLDGPSLSTTATASSHLNSLCSDDTLWSHICASTWPSITHPRLNHIISTFTHGHRSFFDDSFPSLTTDIHHRTRRQSWSNSKPHDQCPLSHLNHCSSELISAVDIRYQNDIVYSTVKFTETTSELFQSSPFRIELDHKISRSIDLKVDEIAGADKETVSYLKGSLTLNWILIDPTRKRACNLSSVKAVSVKSDWVTNETHIRYVTVLPGCDPNEMVECRIHVVLGVGEGGVGLKVKGVVMKLQGLDSSCLNGMEFLEIMGGAIVEKNNVRRKVVDDEERWRSYKVFKEMKRDKNEWVKRKQRKMEVVVNFGFFALVFFYVCLFCYLRV